MTRQETSTAGRKRMRRLAAVVGAIIAAVLVWIIAHVAAGVALSQPAFSAAQKPQTLGVPFVIATAAIASLLAWGLLALIERWAGRPRAVWTTIAVIVLLVSFSMPLSGHGVTMANRVSLLLMHIAVGLALIPAMAATAPRRKVSQAAGNTSSRTSARVGQSSS